MNGQRKAKFRLERMKIKEVSGVDRPANLQPFIIVKAESADAPVDAPVPATPESKGEPPTDATVESASATDETNKAAPPPPHPPAAPAAPAPAAPPAAPPAPKTLGELGPLPSAVKQNVLDAAAASIEKIQALAMAVGEAPVDENAAIPPELGAMFYDCAEDLEELAQMLGASVDMAKPPMPAPPPAPAAPPAGGPPTPPHPPFPAKKSLDEIVVEEMGVVKTEIGVLKSALDEVAKTAAGGELKTSIDRLTLQLQVFNSRSIVKSLPVPNGQPPEPTDVQTKSSHEWPEDLAESARQKLEKARLARGS